MSKSARTYELEEIITLATARSNRVGCAEVGLDEHGIVDFISIEVSKPHTIRCYELKVSKSDFLSNNKKSFVGDFNYYVLPTELWDEVKGLVEPGIGIWLVDKKGRVSVKKSANKMKCPLSRKRVMGKVMRALNRENLKHTEKAWRDRQLGKDVVDAAGARISVGDIVEYHGERYKICSISYARDKFEMKPECAIEPLERTDDEIMVRPSIVRKVRISDIITEYD